MKLTHLCYIKIHSMEEWLLMYDYNHGVNGIRADDKFVALTVNMYETLMVMSKLRSYIRNNTIAITNREYKIYFDLYPPMEFTIPYYEYTHYVPSLLPPTSLYLHSVSNAYIKALSFAEYNLTQHNMITNSIRTHVKKLLTKFIHAEKYDMGG